MTRRDPAPHFLAYTRQVLACRLDGEPAAYACAPAKASALATIARQAARAGGLVLLGYGLGHALEALLGMLPEHVAITVCEPHPEQVRPSLEGWTQRFGRSGLVADTSLLAMTGLLAMAGAWPGPALAVNPEAADPTARQTLRRLGALLGAYAPLPLGGGASAALGVSGHAQPRPGEPGAPPDAPCATGQATLGLAAILHPGEPDLDGFFAALPPFAKEMTIVWDATAPPTSLPQAPFPIRHLAHPLEGDFAAQRNRMLAACACDWTLVLDADERPSPELAALLPRLISQDQCRHFALARQTLAPGGVRVGFGLWPDVQVRLFRTGPRLRYVRPVHERLEGLHGPAGVVFQPAILHLSGLLKSAAALSDKHALFDRADGRAGLHRVNEHYPLLPPEFFKALGPPAVTGKFDSKVVLGGLSS